MNCHACGAPLGATARFCHKCGAQVGGTHTSGWRAGLPWGVAGAALGGLPTLLPPRLGAGGRGHGAGAAPGATAPPPPPPPPPIFQKCPPEPATPPSHTLLYLPPHG